MKTTNFLRGRRGSQMTPEERAALESTLGYPETFEPRKLIVEQDTLMSSSILLLDGMMPYMDDRRGHRQLVALQVPGDFVDLHGYPLQNLDHDVATITRVTVAFASHDKLTAVTNEHPHLTRMDVSQARKLRVLEDENAKLKKLLAEAILDNAVLKEVTSKNW